MADWDVVVGQGNLEVADILELVKTVAVVDEVAGILGPVADKLELVGMLRKLLEEVVDVLHYAMLHHIVNKIQLLVNFDQIGSLL